MNKTKPKVIIAHGWAGDTRSGWINWLTQELSQQGYSVQVPQLPAPRRPVMEDWINTLINTAGESKDLILVGHSLGTFALRHLIKRLPSDVKVQKLILVAGFYLDENSSYWEGYHLTGDDFAKIKARCEQIYCIYSNNDKMVEPNWTRIVCDKLDGNLILLPKMGHFTQYKVDKIPTILDIISQNN